MAERLANRAVPAPSGKPDDLALRAGRAGRQAVRPDRRPAGLTGVRTELPTTAREQPRVAATLTVAQPGAASADGAANDAIAAPPASQPKMHRCRRAIGPAYQA